MHEGLGTFNTLHARHLLGSQFSSGQISSRSRRSGRLLLPTGLHAGLGPTFLPGLQRACEKWLTTAKANRVPIDRPSFGEVDQVEHALRVEVRARLFRAGENEATTTNLTQAFTGLLGHGVNQFEVRHTDDLHGKGETGQGNTGTPAANAAGREKENTPGSQRGRRGDEKAGHSSQPQRFAVA